MSKPTKKNKSNKGQAISPAQQEKLRQQLSEILKAIQSQQHSKHATTITALLRKYPALPEVNFVASMFYAQSAQRDKAIYYAQRAINADPSVAQYHSTLGTIYVQMGKYEEAIEPLKQSIRLDPSLQQSHSALGVAYQQTGQIAKAIQTLDNTIANFPNDHEAIMNRALLESDLANAHNAVEIMQAGMDRFADNPIMHDSLAMYASYDDQLTPQQVFEIHQAFGRCVQAKVRTPRNYPNTPDPDKRIRIGFISPDFKTHSIAYFVEPIFKHLDRSHFELFIYSASSARDNMTDRLESYADTWRTSVGGLAQVHKQIVNDRIDILVELTGHFASNLLPLFGAKPAPVSITAIGYGNTTGLESIDARIVDEITDPTPSADALATEQLIRVEGCFLCYVPPTDAPDLREPEPDRPFTFGSFNDLRKMSPSTLTTWASILKETPPPRLVLKPSRLAEQEVQADILSRFQLLSIDPSRIDLLARTPTTRDHLDLYNQIDCSLDTFPYTGTTTTCESLMMGVPVLTLLGQAHAGRVSASLLEAVHIQSCIAHSTKEYIDKASAIASQGVRCADDRQALRDQLMHSPLVDQVAYCRKIEEVYRTLWKAWCEKQGAK